MGRYTGVSTSHSNILPTGSGFVQNWFGFTLKENHYYTQLDGAEVIARAVIGLHELLCWCRIRYQKAVYRLEDQ